MGINYIPQIYRSEGYNIAFGDRNALSGLRMVKNRGPYIVLFMYFDIYRCTPWAF